MQNQHAAIMRRLSDPDFQASLVNKSLGLVTGLSVLLAVFVVHDLYVWTHPPAPRYFFVDGKNPPRPVTPLNSPILSDVELLDWAVTAMLAPYNIDFQNYSRELNEAGRRFTADAWRSWAASYIGTGNFEELKKSMLVCSAQSQQAALITDVKLVDGALEYRIQVPIVQTCRNSQQQNTQKLMMTAVVKRTDAEDHSFGLVVDQLIAVAR